MKRIGFIYEKVYEIENIKKAIMRASEEKRNQPNVKRILNDIDRYSKIIQDILKSKSYVPSPYTIEKINDGISGKTRTLHKPRFFPDQCIHWALMLQLEPIFMRGMYYWNCGSIKGRGTKRARQAVERWIRNDIKNTKYCFKGDVKQFYDSISHSHLKAVYRNLIKDDDVIWLLDEIVDSVPSGVPIGNYTSQWLGNLMLTPFDHYVKEVLHVKYYVRYLDDIVMFGSNYRKMKRVKNDVEKYLNSIGLRLKENSSVFRVEYTDKKGKTRGRKIDFVGFIIGRKKTRIRKRIAIRIMRNCRRLHKRKYTFKNCSKFMSYNGWLKHSDSYMMRKKYVFNKVDMKRVRRVVSNEAKRRNNKKQC